MNDAVKNIFGVSSKLYIPDDAVKYPLGLEITLE
jgi:hypothetical protein